MYGSELAVCCWPEVVNIVLNGPEAEVAIPTSNVPVVAPKACSQKESSASPAAEVKSIAGDTIAPLVPPPVLVSK